MATQNASELSMDEILASIRNILQEEGNPRQTASKEQIIPVSPFISKPEETKAVSASSDNDEQDINSICANIREMVENAEHGKITPDIFEEEPEQPVNRETKPDDTESAAIVKQFANIFNRRTTSSEIHNCSARDLAREAVINEVIPVLTDWLKEYLPELVRKEIERVMVKAERH